MIIDRLPGETAYQYQGRCQRERQAAREKRQEQLRRESNRRIRKANAWVRSLRSRFDDSALDHDYSMNG